MLFFLIKNNNFVTKIINRNDNKYHYPGQVMTAAEISADDTGQYQHNAELTDLVVMIYWL
jgi:hypothetical protein